ncbi:MAG: hypothetical protein HYW26_01020 [Candidatus Aenigmarchaeota archaeon]|nr:hypothetical protein [Candidatus Aenigmarchaeota archaeon]
MKKEILVFAVVVIFLMSYAAFSANMEGTSLDAHAGPDYRGQEGVDNRPAETGGTPGVVKSGTKSFVVKKYTGPAAPETATKTNLDFPAPENISSAEQQPKAEEKQKTPEKTAETPKDAEQQPIAQPKGGLCGDCDTQTKTGLSFRISGDVNVLTMAVCAGSASEKECREAPACGIDKPCICESFLKNICEVRCFNTKGKYYVTVDGFRGLFDSVDEKDPAEGGYDYECPAVSTESLAKTRENLLQLQGKISGIAAKVDLIVKNAPDNDTTAAFQKYSDTLKKISDMIDARIKSIDAVLASPTEEGIQQNQAEADGLKKDIADMLKTLQ